MILVGWCPLSARIIEPARLMSPCRNDKTLRGWTATQVAAFRHTLDNGKLTENDFMGLRWRQHA